MYNFSLRGHNYTFRSLNELMGKANEFRSGDAAIGLVAKDAKERVAAQYVLAELPLKTFLETPAVPYEKCEVTRVSLDGLKRDQTKTIEGWTVSELREFFLRAEGAEISALTFAWSPEMVAAAVKLCSNMDLMAIAGKLRIPSTAKTTIGRPGTLSSRLQPNHPTDSPAGILALIYEGLAYGTGDCLIGNNPAIDSVESVTRIARSITDVIEKYEVPTPACVLAHITTQMKALAAGAPLDILFQSIAGTQTANKNFGVDAALLRQAHQQIDEKHRGQWANVLYFETGQGSEQSLESHHGVDQMTLEARTYGFARAFEPYMVNNVSGFIGPEILADGKQMIRANLEDLAMAKLMGLPMGMAPCYTTHADIDQNDHEIATMLLTLGGANFFMAIAQNEDVMLGYQDTSFHDNVALRRMYGLRPTPEFEKWLEKMGLWAEGQPTERFGDASVFAG